MSRSSRFVSTPPPEWLVPLQPFNVAGGPLYLCDWMEWGQRHTALRFVIVNSGAGDLVATPEASYDALHVEAGAGAPVPFTVTAGTAYGDAYGIDVMVPFYRLSVSGTSSGQWGVLALSRF